MGWEKKEQKQMFFGIYVVLWMIICNMSSLVVVVVVGQERIKGKPPCDFSGIYNFGDSNSDTGATSAAFLPIPAPYGISFYKKPAGRSSDGRLLIDFIALNLGKQSLGAYLDTINTDYRHGANFATGGSTIRRQNESFFENGVSPFSLDIQVIQFTQFKARTGELYGRASTTADRGQLQRPEDFSKALFTLDIGQDDLLVGLRRHGEQRLRAEIPDIVEKFAVAVRQLYQQGARAFWIHNTGPIGCLPVATLNLQNPRPGFLDQQGCIRNQNDIAVEFNKQLRDRVVKLRSELNHAALTYVNVYAAKYQLISNTEAEGFNEPHKICCGRHEGNAHIWCGQKGIINGTEVQGGSCPTPSAYVSWDGLHYSQAANQWVANRILSGSLSDPPIPITHACYKNL